MFQKWCISENLYWQLLHNSTEHDLVWIGSYGLNGSQSFFSFFTLLHISFNNWSHSLTCLPQRKNCWRSNKIKWSYFYPEPPSLKWILMAWSYWSYIIIWSYIFSFFFFLLSTRLLILSHAWKEIKWDQMVLLPLPLNGYWGDCDS